MTRVAILLSAVALIPSSLTAQSIVGTVRTASGGQVVPVAIVSLVAIDDVTLDFTTTDAEGRFRLVPPMDGIFKVAVTRLGYRDERSDWIAVRGDETHRVEIELTEAPIELDSLRVIAENDGVTPGQVKFMRRRELGRGHFITAAEIRAAGSPTLPDLIRVLPDMYLDSTGQVKSRASQGNGEKGTVGCLRYVWNDFAVAESRALRVQIEEVYGVRIDPLTGAGEGTILEMIPVSSTAGIEVYPSYDDVPEELRFFAWPPAGENDLTKGPPSCGLVVIWDGGGWGNVPEGGG